MRINLNEELELYRDLLKGNIVPFWIKHGIDEQGGINTCLKNDGLLVSRDKWLWSQWRAVWVFSKLFNNVDHDSKFLDIARQIFGFCKKFGWDDSTPGWLLRVGGNGEPQAGCESIYVDGFAIYGLAELYRATSDEQVAELGIKTAQSVLKRLDVSGDQIPHFPYPIPPGARVHGIPMILSLALWELGQALGESAGQKYRNAAKAMSDDIFQNFYRPDRDVILERISLDNSEYPAPLGTVVVPGHVIEDMWFQIHIARDCGDQSRIDESIRLMKRHLELGWDEEYGGILLGVDADGKDDIGWEFADTKLWWPHTEALYGLLLAYEYTRADWCLDWYEKVREYSFSHYPNPACGEWMQKLDRQGKEITDIVALPVKDPFHLPRAAIYCIDVLQRMTK